MSGLANPVMLVMLACAVLSMAGAFGVIIAMMRYREPDRSLIWYAVNGHAFFTGKGFLPGAAPLRRWLIRFYAAFFACLALSVLYGFVGG